MSKHTGMTGMRISPEDRQRRKALAERLGVSESEVVRIALRQLHNSTFAPVDPGKIPAVVTALRELSDVAPFDLNSLRKTMALCADAIETLDTLRRSA